jgi:hypothetical protein
MKQVWLRANSATSVTSHLAIFVLLWFELVERDGLDAHGAQAGYEEGCREPFPNNFAVELVGRLVDAQLLEHPGKLFVADAAPHHLFLYQPLRFFFPLPVRLELQPATHVRQFFHRSLLTSFKPPFFCCRNSLTANFGRIRPVSGPAALNVLSKLIFCEDRMLTITLQPSSPTRRSATASRAAGQTRWRLQAPAGGAK